MTYQRRIGNIGEDIAVDHLIKKGYELLERNFITRFGEVDIIAFEGEMVVFVEVKTRTSSHYGMPEISITPEKLKRLEKTGLLWLQEHPEAPDDWRIDVVAVLMDQHGHLLDIHHFINGNL